jgi:hypothetical protein
MKIKTLLLVCALFLFFGCKKSDKSLSSKIEYEDIKVTQVKHYLNNPKYASYSFDINIQLPKITPDTLFKDLRKTIIENIFNVNIDTTTINQAINQYIAEKTDAFGEPGVQRFMSEDNQYELWSKLNCKFIYAKDNLCSYKIHEDNYTAGAHPYQEVFYMNYDLLEKKKLNFEDIFIPSTQTDLTLKEMLINQLKKQEKAQTISDLNLFDVVTPKDFKVSQMVYFDSLDIVFAYAQYDVRAYAYGAPEIKLQISQVMNYFTDDFKKRHFTPTK